MADMGAGSFSFSFDDFSAEAELGRAVAQFGGNNEFFTPQEQVDAPLLAGTFDVSDVVADHTIGDMSGTNEGLTLDSPQGVHMGPEACIDPALLTLTSALASTGNTIDWNAFREQEAQRSQQYGQMDAGNSTSTLPAPIAGNKRRRGAQDGDKSPKRRQRKADPRAAPQAVDTLPEPTLGPTKTFDRPKCESIKPKNWNAANGQGNRQGLRPGWSQACSHHEGRCKPFGENGVWTGRACDAACLLREKFPRTCSIWEEQCFLIEWDDSKQQEVVSGFFINSQKKSQRKLKVCGELDQRGYIDKTTKKVSCWDAHTPFP